MLSIRQRKCVTQTLLVESKRIQPLWKTSLAFKKKTQHFFFKLEYSCFAMLCQFQVYSKVNQSYIYRYTHFFFLNVLFPHRSLQSIEQQFPVLQSRCLLVICFIYSGVYMLIQSLCLSSSPFPGNHKFAFYISASTSIL